jgi:hypothetical protein
MHVLHSTALLLQLLLFISALLLHFMLCFKLYMLLLLLPWRRLRTAAVRCSVRASHS